MKCATSEYLPASNVTVPANQHSPGLVLASSLHMHQPECIQGSLEYIQPAMYQFYRSGLILTIIL